MPAKEHSETIRLWYARAGAPGQPASNAGLALLPPAQQVFFHSLRTFKRQQQYLYSRLLMCTALSQCYRQPTTGWEIEERENAPPLVHNLPFPAYISLSHSHHLLCFGLSPSRIGIDVEWMKSGRRFREMAPLFMNNEEVALLPTQAPGLLQYFYQVWCAKEALYKALPPARQALTTLKGLPYHPLLEDSSPWHLVQSGLDNYQIAIVTENMIEKSTARPTLQTMFIDLEQVIQNTGKREQAVKKGPNSPFGDLQNH